ncbi:probable cytochrome P450 318a1 [Anastrepha obliqua]|uniref:probable cytochrome P450 318a1 n=1 Tax=Anastrepha obliqua TaxID=95512 RepID=UPI0024097A6F|nr:probable cytochrome P450 318a1 [Anastrepha obliqua]
MLLASLLLIFFIIWWQRNAWLLVWRLNGWRGMLQQPYLWFIFLFYLEPKKLLQAVSRIRPHFQRPLAIVFGNKTVIYVDDPATMEQFFNAPECIDKSFFQNGFCLRRGLLHAKGAAWKSRRRQLDPAFGSKVLLSFIDTFNTVGNQLVHKFDTELLGDNVQFNILDEMFCRAVLEVSCQTTMDTETNFTAADTQGIARTYSELMDISALKGTKPWLQVDFIFYLLDTKNYKRSQELMKHLEEFVKIIVQRKHAEWKAGSQSNISNIGTNDADSRNTDGAEDPKDVKIAGSTNRRRIFIEQIFHMVDTGELRMEDVMDEALSMLMVSFETISTSVLVTVLLLAMHEDCQRKLREEITTTFPKQSQIFNIDPTQLLQMTYLDSIVYESLRLLTTVPFNMRAVSRDFYLQLNSGAGGITRRVKVPKDTALVFDVFNMQRDTKFWGAHAKEFHPEHFAAGSTGSAERHPYAFVPFAKGLRYCIGNRYSMYLAKIFLVKLIYHFEFGTSIKLDDLIFVNGISLKFGNSESINFQIRKLNESNA